MDEQVTPSVLHRMVGQKATPVAEVPVTASRAMRLAVTRAAERTVALQLTVISVGEENLSLEGVQSALTNDLLLLKLLHEDGSLVGVLALDTSLVAAIVEMQTTGQVNATTPEQRDVTLADLVLAQPFMDGLFAHLLETTPNTALDGWTADVRHADRFENVRAIGLALAHVNYRLMRLTLDLGATDRNGELLLALPAGDVVQTPDDSAPKMVNWAQEMQETVLASPAALSAILHRFDLPLHRANNLRVGQVLALPGCTVSSLELVGPDGARVARAKLGQVAGHVAVRLEDPITPPMRELPPRKVAALEAPPAVLSEEGA